MRLILLGLVALSGCGPSTPPEAKEENGTRTALGDDAVTENNRGVGLMGQFQYTPAREVFAQLHETYPRNVDLIANLAIARLNEQGEANVARAMQLLDTGIELEPDHPRARYCRGLLRLYNGQPAEAVDDFTVANEEVPRDPDAAYLRGLCLEQSGRSDEAGSYYERALELEPYYASALIGLSRVARQAGDIEAAKQALADFSKLKENPYARVFEFKYMAMGRLGEAWTIGEEPLVEETTLSGPLFAAVESVPVDLPAERSSATPECLTFADLNGDTHLDMVLCAEETNCVVLLNDGAQNFSMDASHPLSRLQATAVLHGDINNDGHVDQVLLGSQGVALVLGGDAPTVRSLATELEKDLASRGGVLFDADHDGDLDIFCVRTNANDVILNNNGDGTFRLLDEAYSLPFATGETRQACVADFDNDRDLDLLLVKDDGSLVFCTNDRLWNYEQASLPETLRSETFNVESLLVGDLNQDGWMDLLTLLTENGARKLVVWEGAPELQFTRSHERDLEGAAAAALPAPVLALGDVNGDGLPELLHTDTSSSVQVLDHQLAALHQIDSETPLQGWGLAAFRAEQGPSLVTRAGGGLGIAAPGPARHKFVTVTFGGKLDVGDSLRSNRSGIGTRWQAHAGRFATSGVTLPTTTGPGQSLQPTQIGLGGKPQLDMLEMVWPDGVFQSELALKAGTTRRVTETQRQLSSCPVLFAWNGEAYAFVTDLIGVGGLGYLVKPGVYGSPRPFERLLLDQDQLVPRAGRLALKLGEPMEEACYLDHVAMQQVDVPEGWAVALDERAGVNPPLPTSELFFYRPDQVIAPDSAFNDRGEDMLAAIDQRDGVAADVGPVDPRFIGMLEREHQLTVTFARPIDDDTRVPVLLIDGWIEYPYSQTNFAAWQAGLEHEEPTIEARNAEGQWVRLLDKFGYPAGMPRSMSVPLADLPPGATELRIRTNLEIYWDRLRIAYPEPCPEASIVDLPLRGGSLARVGFARRSTGPQRRPHYDYQQRTPTWDARHPLGYYTRFGDVTELLTRREDAVAIFGPGEEVHFEFEATKAAPGPGVTRWYVLSAAGWCKDMDMYTATGGTLEPLPRTSDTVNPDRDRLHTEYNTRLEAGR